jgi:Ca2+:H+ antiporter
MLTMPLGALLVAACVIALIGTVIASVHHAEVVAHRVGEPFGTLVLAVAITVIEVALIVSVMLAGGPDKAGLARDTIFAAVMIIVNGVVGISVLLGALAHGEQSFRIEGAGPALAALVTLATLSLVLPTLTTSSSGPTYSEAQLLLPRWSSSSVGPVCVRADGAAPRLLCLPMIARGRGTGRGPS